MLAGLDPASNFKAIVSGGTPTDLTVWPNARLVKQFLGSKIEEKPELWKQASPLFNIGESSPPVFMYHGKWDKIVELAQMEKMQAALQAKKRIVETFTTDFLSHITVYLFSRESILRGIDFLNRQL